MKRNAVKRSIYLRTFCALAATYLVLMTGFTFFLLLQEKKKSSMELRASALITSNSIESILRDHTDNNNQVTDAIELKKALFSKGVFLTGTAGEEVALYSKDYSLLFHTSDSLRVSYTTHIEGTTHYTGYVQLNVRDWFSEKEALELEQYILAQPKAKKVGDLTGYNVQLEGFWLDGYKAIPEKLLVIPMYASGFREDGKVSSSSSGPKENTVVYASSYTDTRNLSHISFGGIQPVYRTGMNRDQQAALRNMVLDKDRLVAAAQNPPYSVSYERVSGLTYRYYLVQPFQNAIEVTDENINVSDYWTVVSQEVNLWNRCAGTLLYVGTGCFFIFLVVAFILSSQTYKTYRRREELDRYRKETSNALAHDLKTPLSIISGYAQNLIENVQTTKREQYAASILTNVNRMDNIIRDMLEMSRYESDSSPAPVQFSDVSLREVCSGIISRYASVCEEKSVTAHLEGDSVVKGDSALLERVIDNFFVNALDHVPDGGTIRISITEQALECFNSGSAIPEDMIHDIWLPYKKADTSRSNSKGTGLGLTISRSILELHHFQYGARNSEDGVTFWFRSGH
jgi:signal transduction histidine kinase